MAGFIFGGDTGATYEQVQRRRQIADQLMAQGSAGTPRSVGEGISSFAKSITGALIGRKADKRDDALRSEADKLWENSMGSLFGGGGASMSSRSAPTGAPVTPVTTAPLPTEGDLLGNDAMAAIGRTPNNPTAQPTTSVSTRGAQPSFLELAQQNIFPGESGGDYNALFGYSNRDGGKFDGVQLTNMTVDQALDFSKPSGEYGQHVKGQVGRVATPMGAYQVVGTTLRAAKDGLGLTGNEIMTPQLQDRIGEWIYQNQGPAAWEAWGKGGGAGGGAAPRGGGQGGGRPNVSTQQIVELLSNPYIRQDPAKAMVLQSLLQQNLAGPQQGFSILSAQEAAQMGLPTDGAYQRGPDGRITAIGGGGTNVDITMPGASEIGTIPQGYELFTDPDTGARSLRPIVGGPEDTTASDAAAAGNDETASDLITTAAGFARDADGERIARGLFGNLAAINPSSANAEIERQLGVLRGIAKTGNLQAMREASKTGGALGSVSAPELTMLEEMSGALDPASPNFARDLDNYERTLLRTIHGPAEGDRIFEATRGAPRPEDGQPDADGYITLPNGVRIREVK